MIVPSKFITIGDSVLGNVVELLIPGVESMSLKDLYFARGHLFECIDRFLYALDILYVLGKIDIDFERELVVYAD